jgi:AraC-like DNA-binding protein
VPEANKVPNEADLMSSVRVRTEDWPEHERLTMFREFGGKRVRVEPLPDEPFRIDATFMNLPNLRLISVRRSALRSEFADGKLRLMINLGGDALASRSGRDFALKRGDAIALTGDDGGSFTTVRSGHLATIEFGDASLVPGLADAADSRSRHLAARSPALLLLRNYLQAICADDLLQDSALRSLAAAHIEDLAALALSADRETQAIASGRAVRAARLRLIKADIRALLESPISLGDLAGRHQLSPRYIRMLFAGEGTSFSEFVREERLVRARQMLLGLRFDHRRISDIAYQVGFSDLSYFNRCFRRRFGVSPTELRQNRVFY